MAGKREEHTMPELIYLATAYSHKSFFVMQERYTQASRILGELMKQGKAVFSPIAHTHAAAILVDLPKDWQFWQAHCELMLSKCDKLLVVKMDGWQESRGVQAEIEFAKKLGMPVEYLEV